MDTLPSGTVTFLFTDIEGSTNLWQQHPVAMPAALARHHTILNDSVAKHGGYVFQIVGDAFCAAFGTASDGLDAALAAQRALSNEPWRETGAVRVRMALHTGAAEVRAGEFTSGEYVSSLTLSRAARLLSAAHGGQILLSLPTAELVRDKKPLDVTLRDLEAHRLKDLIRPEHIYQVVAPDLPSDFLPLKTLDTHPNNLPIQLTSFIGRKREMAEVKRLLSTTRLLTLTGAGGTGKTRLALQVAADLIDEFPDGVWVIELAPLADPTLIPQTVVSVLGLYDESGQAPMRILADYLNAKAALLVLDNCEHLIDACARFADAILHATPNVKILAPSRETFGIGGETTYHVPSLALPPRDPNLQQLKELSQYEAVRLFTDRALAVQPEFRVTNMNAPAVVQICYRLDGIPLAIELAAARVKVLAVEQIAARLDDAFRVLTGGSRTAMPRQQTLRASIDWSHGLLETAERVLFRRLAIFAGGWTLDAAEGTCAGDGFETCDVLDLLQSLVNKSLVTADEQTDCLLPRYHLLETVRQYAREKLLESGEGRVLRERHLNYFLQLAEVANPKLQGAEQVNWLNRLDGDQDNFRTALTCAMETAADKGLCLSDSLSDYWRFRGYWFEAREWFAKMLALPAASSPTAARARVLGRATHRAYFQGDRARLKAMLEESMAIWKTVGDKKGLAKTLDDLGRLASAQGDFAIAEQFYREGLDLCREQGDKPGTGRALLSLGNVAAAQRDWTKATALLQESLVAYRELGSKEISFEILERNPAHELGLVAESQGDFARALEFYEEALTLEREMGNTHHIAWALRYLGGHLCREGDFARAKSLYEESLTLVQSMRDKHCTAHCLAGLARVAEQAGDNLRAVGLAEEALALYEQLGSSRRIADAQQILGGALSGRDSGRATGLLKSSLALRRQMGPGRKTAETLQALASVYLLRGLGARAVQFFGMADAVREQVSSPMTTWEHDAREKELTTARAQLAELAFSAAWNEGRAKSIEQAIEFALAESDA